MSSALTTNVVDAAALADELARFRVVPADRMTELLAEFPGGDPVALAEFLVARGVLTPFQADRALAGEARLLVLGPYRVTAPAGPGTFGPVYSATHRDHTRPTYRVRVFPLRSLWQARRAKQFVRSLADPPHPLVVPPADADSANGFHYLVWPHADGVPLADRVAASGPLSPGEAAGVLAHLAEALHACHARGVAHGALTPGCVLLAPDGLPRLLELGAGGLLAENLADGESLLDTLSAAVAAGDVLGYAAPEFAADPKPSPAADQYALGAIGYFALSGRAPFPDLSLADRLAAKLAGPPASLTAGNPAVPADLAGVVGRMLLPSPADRFTGLDEVHEVLAGIAGQSVLARPLPGAPAPEPELESLRLSTLRAAPPGGPVGWPPSGPGTPTRPPSRDGSASSVDFDIPEPDFGEPLAPAAREPDPVPDTPSRAAVETRPAPVAPRPRPDGRGLETTPPPNPHGAVATPVRYHTEAPQDDDPLSGTRPVAAAAAPPGSDAPPSQPFLWRKVKRNVLFWKPAADVIQVSVFGPPAVAPGKATPLSVFLHTTDDAESVRTLSRAFQHDAELIGSGFVAKEVSRGTELAVHLTLANAGVSKSLVRVAWRGRPERLVFDLHVPWEAPAGAAPGIISVGRDDVRIGKIEFRLNLLPRSG